MPKSKKFGDKWFRHDSSHTNESRANQKANTLRTSPLQQFLVKVTKEDDKWIVWKRSYRGKKPLPYRVSHKNIDKSVRVKSHIRKGSRGVKSHTRRKPRR